MSGRASLPPHAAALAEIRTMGRGLGGTLFRRTFEIYRALQKDVSRDGIAVTADIRYGGHERQRLDVHAPKDRPDAPMPVVIFFHGGGFSSGDKVINRGLFYGNVGAYFARAGMVFVNATYRFAPEFQWPEGSRDVGNVIDWTRANIAAYGGDPGRIVVSGHSSGATHVAGWMLHKDLQPKDGGGVKGVILMSGQYGPREAADNPRQIAYFGEDVSRYPAMSVIGNVGPAPVPVFLVYAAYDSQAFQAAGLALAAELTVRHGRSPWIRMIPAHNHMSEILSLDTGDEALGPDLLAFVRAVTAPA